MDDGVARPGAPRRLRADELTDAQSRLAKHNPVLALHDGPWILRQRSALGLLLIVAGPVIGVAAAIVLLVGQMAGSPLLATNELILTAFIALVVVVAFIGIGQGLRRGILRDAVSGKRLDEERINIAGTVDFGSEIYAGLADGSLTRTEISSGARRDGWSNDLFLRVYRKFSDGRARATVHFVDGDSITVWPLLELPEEYADELLKPSFEESGLSAPN